MKARPARASRRLESKSDASSDLSTEPSIQSLQFGHDPRRVDPGAGRTEAFARSSRSPASVVSIARSSALTAGESPPVARNRTRWLA